MMTDNFPLEIFHVFLLDPITRSKNLDICMVYNAIEEKKEEIETTLKMKNIKEVIFETEFQLYEDDFISIIKQKVKTSFQKLGRSKFDFMEEKINILCDIEFPFSLSYLFDLVSERNHTLEQKKFHQLLINCGLKDKNDLQNKNKKQAVEEYEFINKMEELLKEKTLSFKTILGNTDIYSPLTIPSHCFETNGVKQSLGEINDKLILAHCGKRKVNELIVDIKSNHNIEENIWTSYFKSNETLLEENEFKLRENWMKFLYAYRNKDIERFFQKNFKINFQLLGKDKCQLSLDVLFRKLSASRKIPVIKYQDLVSNQFRFFSSGTTMDGTKIPFIKTIPTKLASKLKSRNDKIKIVFYIPLKEKEEIIISLFENGTFEVDIVISHLETMKQLEKLLKTYFNPIIEILNEFTYEYGTTQTTLFDSFLSPLVKVNKIDFFISFAAHSSKLEFLKITQRYEKFRLLFIDAKFLTPSNDDIFSFKLLRYDLEKNDQKIPNVMVEHDLGAINLEVTNCKSIHHFRHWYFYLLKLFYILTDDHALENEANGFTYKANNDISIVNIEPTSIPEKKKVVANTVTVTEKEYENLLEEADEEEGAEEEGVEAEEAKAKQIEAQAKEAEAAKAKEAEAKEAEAAKAKEAEAAKAKEAEAAKAKEAEAAKAKEAKAKEAEAAKAKEAEEAESDSDSDASVASLMGGAENYWLQKIRRLDPKISSNKKFVRTVQKRKMPLVLTPKEFQEYETNYPDKKDRPWKNVVEYGLTPGTSNYYVCPEYFCYPRNKAMTTTDIEKGKCFDIGKDKKRKYYYLQHAKYETKNKSEKGLVTLIDRSKENDRYVALTNQDPDYNICFPGCVKKDPEHEHSLKKGQLAKCQKKYFDRTKAFQKDENNNEKEDISIAQSLTPSENEDVGDDDEDEEDEDEAENKNINHFTNSTILKEINKKYLKFGYLSSCHPTLLSLFKIEAEDKTKNSPFTELYVLRSTISLHNAFLLSILDIANRQKQLDQLEKIVFWTYETFIENLITEDGFNTFYNGNLPTIFGTFEKFIEFLTTPNIFIDYTFVWDFLCQPSQVFTKGLNLILFETSSTNMEIICPRNIFTLVPFDVEKPTIFLCKTLHMYFHIYAAKLTDIEVKGEKKKKTKHTVRSIEEVMFTSKEKQEKENYETKSALKICSEKLNLCEEKETSFPLLVKNLLMNKNFNELYTIKDVIVSGVLKNKFTKAIGFWVQEKNNPESVFYIPFFPILRTLLPETLNNIDAIDLGQKIMDLNLSKERYSDLLTKFSNQLKIPLITLNEENLMIDGKDVGFLTNTFQFIPFTENYKMFEDMNDKIKKNIGEDPNRLQNYQPIRMESEFYNAFLTTARIVINKRENIEIKKLLMIKSPPEEYLNELKDKYKKLVDLLEKYFIFRNTPNKIIYLQAKGKISVCKEKENSYCKKEDDMYKLIIPENNLVDPTKKNKMAYFFRLADEMIRYSRIRQFLFHPEQIYNLSFNDFHKNDDEIIFLESTADNELKKRVDSSFVGNEFIQAIPYEMVREKLKEDEEKS